jgi:L-fuculose-phosphate aldolase
MTKFKHLESRKSIIATCLQLNALGINQGTSGNVSQRTPDGYLLTASGIAYDRMGPEHVVEMDLDAGYVGDLLPSSEWRMHQDIYRARPEAGAVIHVHSNHATALSSLRRDIPAFHYMIAVAGGPTLRCADYATFGTQALSDAMLAAMEDRSACLLANHGLICFAGDLSRALWLAVEIESLCKQYILALQAGEPVILDEDEMDRVLERFKTYGKQAHETLYSPSHAVDAPRRRDNRPD